MLFMQFDTSRIGGLNLQNFDNLATVLEIDMKKKETKELFDLIDHNKNGVIWLDEMKRFMSSEIEVKQDT